jgi:16S rRNA (cytosine1402-N4)-methyltransferase
VISFHSLETIIVNSSSRVIHFAMYDRRAPFAAPKLMRLLLALGRVKPSAASCRQPALAQLIMRVAQEIA